MEHIFEVGKEYRNRNGRYEVLEIGETKMRVRYEDGQEVNLTLAIQAQIWAGILLNEKSEEAKPKRRKAPKKRGPKKADEREKLIAEILETDEAIFEILTRLVIPPGQIDLYSFFVKHADEFFSQQQIANEVRGSNLEGQRGVFMAFGRRIGASPDERVRSLKPLNSLFFEHKIIEGKTCLQIRPRIVEIFKSYTQFYDYLVKDGRWHEEIFGSKGWENSQRVYEKQMRYFGFWERKQLTGNRGE